MYVICVIYGTEWAQMNSEFCLKCYLIFGITRKVLVPYSTKV
jgi:hypothetical protein